MKLDKLLKDFQRCKKDAHTQGCLEVMNEIEFRLKVALNAIKSAQVLAPRHTGEVLQKARLEIEGSE